MLEKCIFNLFWAVCLAVCQKNSNQQFREELCEEIGFICAGANPQGLSFPHFQSFPWQTKIEAPATHFMLKNSILSISAPDNRRELEQTKQRSYQSFNDIKCSEFFWFFFCWLERLRDPAGDKIAS